MVIFAFWMTAMLLCLAALALLLPPLLRRKPDGRRDAERQLATLKQRHNAGQLDEAAYQTERDRLSALVLAEIENSGSTPAPTGRALALTLALFLPIAAVALYFGLGEPRALDPRHVQAPPNPEGITPQQLDQAMTGLEQRLLAQPDDIDGWLLLARSYRATERFDDMQRATASALALAPNRPDVLVEHAEAITLNSPSRRFGSQARTFLEQALAIDERHQKALWLLGVAELQTGRNTEALIHWRRLRTLLSPDDPITARIDEQIASIESEAPAHPGTATPVESAVQGPRITVTVELDPSLADQVNAGDTLFVFARNPAGGPPLAIRRMRPPSLPITITLSQADRMLEGMELQANVDVVVGARISRSGQAQAQAGDLEAALLPHTVTQDGSHIILTITDVLP